MADRALAYIASDKTFVTAINGGSGAAGKFTTVTLNDALFPAAEATPTITQTQATAGAGVNLRMQAQQGFTGNIGGILRLAGGQGAIPGTQASGGVQIECGETVAGVSALCSFMTGNFALSILDVNQSGSTTQLVSATNGIAITSATTFAVTAGGGNQISFLTTGVVACGLNSSFQSLGQIANTVQTLGTTGAVAMNCASGAYGSITATANVTALTFTNAVNGADLTVHFVPGGSHFTLSIPAPTVYPTSTYSDAGLATLCGTAVRVIVRLKRIGGITYVLDYTGYSA